MKKSTKCLLKSSVWAAICVSSYIIACKYGEGYAEESWKESEEEKSEKKEC